MRIATIFTMALLSLLTNPTGADTLPSQAFSFSTYGSLSYSETPSQWDAIITWGDGTEETIQISDRGKIFLNGVETKAFGFVLKGSWSKQPSTSIADKMLNWCQSSGVRFMTLIIDAYQNDDTITSRLDFWISKLYEHKMCMVIWLHPRASEKEALLDATTYKNKFNLVVDHIIDLNRKEMIVAFMGGEEWDIQANRFGITQKELQGWFDDVCPHIRGYLSSNGFDRPLGHGVSDSKHWAGQISLQYSDFVFQDWGIGSVYTSALDYWWNYDKEGWSNAGKTGYQAWLSSVHYGIGDVADNSKMTAEYLSHMLEYPELSAYFIWYLWEGWYNAEKGEEHYMFDLDGNPYSWTENLAPYFPY